MDPTPSGPSAEDGGAAASAAPPASPEAARSIEEWSSEKKTHPIWFACARIREDWCVGLLVTEQDYDRAIHDAQHEVSR